LSSQCIDILTVPRPSLAARELRDFEKFIKFIDKNYYFHIILLFSFKKIYIPRAKIFGVEKSTSGVPLPLPAFRALNALIEEFFLKIFKL
jgi:hypothetical protein